MKNRRCGRCWKGIAVPRPPAAAAVMSLAVMLLLQQCHLPSAFVALRPVGARGVAVDGARLDESRHLAVSRG